MALNPSESADYIVKNAKHLKVLPDGIDKLSEIILQKIKSKSINIENFSQNNWHPNSNESHAVEWIFLIDTLNFCFWTPENDKKWTVCGQTGYFALCAAINRAIQEGLEITNPLIYSKIDTVQLAHILRPDDNKTNVPLLEERIECLHEVGTKLIEKFDGKFENCIRICNKSAQKLLDLVITEFPCFRDEAKYNDRRVSLYKRAQILIGDLWSCFQGKDLGEFNDIETITMFADYRVPQVLVHFGTLEYSKDLYDFLKKDELMVSGDEREVEIRAASIYIVEELKRKVLEKIKMSGDEISKSSVNSILLDHFLWDYRRQHSKELEHIPFHKVLGIYY